MFGDTFRASLKCKRKHEEQIVLHLLLRKIDEIYLMLIIPHIEDLSCPLAKAETFSLTAGINSALGGEYAPCPSDTTLVLLRSPFALRTYLKSVQF